MGLSAQAATAVATALAYHGVRRSRHARYRVMVARSGISSLSFLRRWRSFMTASPPGRSIGSNLRAIVCPADELAGMIRE
jgi:hypothetical protein